MCLQCIFVKNLKAMDEDDFLNLIIYEHFDNEQSKEDFEFDNADEIYEREREEKE